MSEQLNRYSSIAGLLVKYRNAGVLQGVALDEDSLAKASEPVDTDAASPEQFVADLEALGPTFIKVGQMLSTRPDLVPDPYREALTRMQDDVEPFAFEQVHRIIEQDLDVRLSKLFSGFDEEPLAAASLGQVHRARLRDGTEVVVKVQRPDIEEVIQNDLAAFKRLAGAVDHFTRVGRQYRFSDWVRELGDTLLSELDYRLEARNLLMVGEAIEDFEEITVPEPVMDLCGERVLTMTYLPGRKVTEIPGPTRTETDFDGLADALIRAYLDQVFVHGVIHSDPHPGNVLLLDDGRLGLIDFGMVAHLNPGSQNDLLKLLFAAVDGRGRDAANLSMELGSPLPEFDRDGYFNAMDKLVARYSAYESEDYLSEGRLVLEMTRIAASHGLNPPSELSLLGKTLLNLDAVTQALSPGFNTQDTVESHLQRVLRHRLFDSVKPSSIASEILEMKEFTRQLPNRLSQILGNLANNRFRLRVEGLDDPLLMKNLQKIANRISSGMVVAALIIGAAMLMSIETRFTLFGYPGLAIIMFALASLLGFYLVISAILTDRRNRESERRR